MFKPNLVTPSKRTNLGQTVSWITLLAILCLTACAPTVRRAEASVLTCKQLGRVADMYEAAHYSADSLSANIGKACCEELPRNP